MPLLDICTDGLESNSILELPNGTNGTISEIVVDSLTEPIIDLKLINGEQTGPTYFAY